jgi:hypothetical protein
MKFRKVIQSFPGLRPSLEIYRSIVEFINIPGVVLRRLAQLKERTKVVSGTEQNLKAPRDGLLRLLNKLSPSAHNIRTTRIGPKHDGGYILPTDLQGVRAVFSPGVGNTLGFEKYFADRGVPCFLADASVSPPVGASEKMKFESIFIGSGQGQGWKTLEAWVDSNVGKNENDLILQMDIEGGEYDVVNGTTLAYLERFRIIIIELHDLHAIRTSAGLDKVEALIDKLLLTHTLIHTHANNCEFPVQVQGVLVPPVIELTLVSKQRYGIDSKTTGSGSNVGKFLASNRNCWYWPEVKLQRIWADLH